MNDIQRMVVQGLYQKRCMAVRERVNERVNRDVAQ